MVSLPSRCRPLLYGLSHATCWLTMCLHAFRRVPIRTSHRWKFHVMIAGWGWKFHGTFVHQLGPRKVWKGKFSHGVGAAPPFGRHARGRESWRVGFVRGLSLEPSSSKVCRWNLRFPRWRRENFGGWNFCDTWALRSVWLVALAVRPWNLLRPTWAAKILKTELLATQRRRAAFRSQRRGPKIVASSLH